MSANRTAKLPAPGAEVTANDAGTGGQVLRAIGISKRYGDFVALDRVDLRLEAGQVVALLGPSGSGKTTLGEILAGTLVPDEGRILLGDTDLAGVPPHRRRIALAPQEWGLFPHMTALENVVFPLWAAGIPAGERRATGRRWLERVGLAGKEDRLPAQLSGGQQQRVAIARALVAPGAFVVLDEPFANVDQDTRTVLRRLVKEVAGEGKGVLFITHDRDDAMRLSTRLVCIDRGRLLQEGLPEEVYRRPSSLEAALLTGDASAIPLRAFFHHRGRPGWTDPRPLLAGSVSGAVLTRPEWLEVVDGGPWHLEARVAECGFLGAAYQLTLDVGVPFAATRYGRPLPAGTVVRVRLTGIERFQVVSLPGAESRGPVDPPPGAPVNGEEERR